MVSLLSPSLTLYLESLKTERERERERLLGVVESAGTNLAISLMANRRKVGLEHSSLFRAPPYCAYSQSECREQKEGEWYGLEGNLGAVVSLSRTLSLYLNENVGPEQ